MLMPIAPMFCGCGFYCSEKEAHVMRKGDAVSGIAITLLGFGVVVYTLAENTMRFNAQTSDGVPGAGFFPVLLGTVLGILGVVLLIRSILEKGGRTPPSGSREETRKNIKMLLLTIAAIVVFFVLWQLTKLFILWALALVVFLNFIFERAWKFNIIYSVVFVAFIYLAFVVGFSVQFNI